MKILEIQELTQVRKQKRLYKKKINFHEDLCLPKVFSFSEITDPEKRKIFDFIRAAVSQKKYLSRTAIRIQAKPELGGSTWTV